MDNLVLDSDFSNKHDTRDAGGTADGLAFKYGGGSGSKLGGGNPAPAVAHVVTHSAAWDNAGYGFTEANNRGTLQVSNSTAYRNGKAGLAFVHSASVLRRDLNLANDTTTWLGEQVDDADNSWNQSAWTTTALRSGDPTIGASMAP